MSDAKSFKCPGCGSALEPDGDEKEVKCAYCGSTVIVPEELRDQDDEDDLTDEEVAEQDPFAPSHVPWLIQHGVDATVKVDQIRDISQNKNMTDVYLYLSGKQADGGKFSQSAEAAVPPLSAIPQPGTMLKIKYNSAKVSDFILQVGGQFYYCWMKNNPAHAADTTTAFQQIDVQAAEKQFEGDPEQKRIDDAKKKRTKGGKALRVIGGIIGVIGILLLLLSIIGWVGDPSITEDFITTVIVCPTPLIVLGAGLFVWGVFIKRKLKEVS